jgi:hypothetical protein
MAIARLPRSRHAGAGGEIFVDVDLDTGVAKVSGHGE